uniref:Cuticle protein n=1 Tax=Cacopsylla melanoneura TaxID=428564 RepID=A0A8D9BS25_9HEMI
MYCSYAFYVHVWILAFLIAELVICQARIEGGWNSAPNTQYHIQTDEGDERYFRYQTLTGQYRKEKRLQDGSVVGTYGWVDADGYLRLKDYVADEQGYRIVRSKKLYVGGNTPIDATVQSSKYVPSQVPPQAGSGVQYKPVYNSYVVDNALPSTYAPQSAHDYHAPAVQNPVYPAQSPYAVTSTQSPYVVTSTQSPYAITSTQSPYVTTSTQNPYAVTSAQPHYAATSTQSPYIPSSTQPPYAATPTQSPYSVTSTESPYAATSTASNIPSYSPSPYAGSPSVSQYSSNDYASPITDNSIVSSTVSPYTGDAYDDYINSKAFVSHNEKPLEFPSNFGSSSKLAPISLADYLQSGSEVQREVAITPHYRFSVSTTPTTPPRVYERITEAPRPVTFRPYYSPNVVSSGFQSQEKTPHKDVEYDGVSLTHDGFKYYLPKHYHEEEGTSSSHRAGSFGYVDPFGIRRVIYYNTSPEKGFVARKNNRYVGHDAAPYDPRY